MATRLKLELTDKGAVFHCGVTEFEAIATNTTLLVSQLGDALEDSDMTDRNGDPVTAGHFLGAVFLQIAGLMIHGGHAGENDLQEIVHNAAYYIAQK